MTEGHFEAVKYAYRQTKEGFVLSFIVHPNDMPDDMATAKIGTHFIVAFAEVKESGPLPGAGPVGEGDGAIREDAQAGNIAANSTVNPSPTSPKPNSTRAVMMAKDPEFQQFCGCATEAAADFHIKTYCGIESKRELNDETGSPALRFNLLRDEFRTWRASERSR